MNKSILCTLGDEHRRASTLSEVIDEGTKLPTKNTSEVIDEGTKLSTKNTRALMSMLRRSRGVASAIRNNARFATRKRLSKLKCRSVVSSADALFKLTNDSRAVYLSC